MDEYQILTIKNEGGCQAIRRKGLGELLAAAGFADAASAAPGIALTESGVMAAFSDGAAGRPLSALTVGITPGVGRTGEVGPGNPRPLTGYAAAKIVRAGKNLFDKDNFTKLNIGATTPSSAGTSTSGNVTGIAYQAAWVPLPGGVTYAISCSTRGSNIFRVIATAEYPVSKAGYQTPYLKSVSAPDADSILFEAPAGTRWIGFALYNSQSEGVSDIDTAAAGLQIEVASASSAFVAFGGEHLDIAFPAAAGTVYAGTLDVLAGTLTVTHAYAQFDGTEEWNVGGTASGQTPYFYKVISDVPNGSSANGWSSHFAYRLIRASTSQIGVGTFYGIINGVSAKVVTARHETSLASTVAEWTTWLAGQASAGTPLQVVYPLYTPVAYTLTAEELTTLYGINRIWADCGTVGVRYTADTKMYIDNAAAALAAQS